MRASKDFLAVSKRMGRAVTDYNMLEQGDRIIAAVSGGRDSLAMLKLLRYRQDISPVKYRLLAVHVSSKLNGADAGALKDYADYLGVEFHSEHLDILDGKQEEEISCFWCSWNRRKALFKTARKLAFNKISFGHHLDDIVETICLNMFFRGEISAMKPKQELFSGDITLIRPLCYEPEQELKAMADMEGIPDLEHKKCHRRHSSKRGVVKELIKAAEQHSPAVKLNIFRSLSRIKQDYLLDRFIGK